MGKNRHWLSFLKRSQHKNQKHNDPFYHLMGRAQAIAEESGVEGLKDLIRIVLRPLQAEHMRDAFLKKPHGAIEELDWSRSLGLDFIPAFNTVLGKVVWSDTCLVRDKTLFPTLDLSTDIVFPTPWNAGSLVQLPVKIGEGLALGPFQSTSNHRIAYSYPLQIGWVNGGNHSIMSAIVRGKGMLAPVEVHDLSAIINAVRFDGVVWRCRNSDELLGMPRYPELGWVWEIGRLIMRLEDSPYKDALKASCHSPETTAT